jgi:transketolase C-terminal domain/subunit
MFVKFTIQWVRKGKAGAIVAFGDTVYRALDAVERLRADGLDVALINKCTLNQVDEDAIREYGSLPFVLVVETQNRKTGLGSKMGTWLLERRLTPRYRFVSRNAHVLSGNPGG